ncbi:MAG: hypothetical protein ACE5HX_20130, partial [bacterium]
LIEEEIINSIEDWTDIISDANIKNHIEAFIDLKLALYYLHKEIERMNSDIKKSRGPAQKGVQELKLKIKENEKEISQLQKNLLERKQMLNNSILSGIANPILNSGISSFGNSFPEPNLISAFSAGSDDGNNQQSPAEVLSLDNLAEVQKGKTRFKNNRKSD